MGLKNLTQPAVMTLCKVFNEGAHGFRGAAVGMRWDKDAAAIDTAINIAEDFERAAKTVLRALHTEAPELLPSLDRQVEDLTGKLGKLTDPLYKNALEDLAFGQKLAYKGLDAQTKEDLGTYALKLF